MKSLMIDCHPNKSSFLSAILKNYYEGLKKNYNDIEQISLYDLKFLFNPENNSKELELEIKTCQEKIKISDHIVFAYPTWWASPPAILKYFFEKVFTPGFAYEYNSINETPFYLKKIMVTWKKLLKGKSTRLLVTMDSPPWFYKYFSGDPGYKMMHDILKFCGFTKINKNYFGSIKMSSEQIRKKWLKTAYKIGVNEKL